MQAQARMGTRVEGSLWGFWGSWKRERGTMRVLVLGGTGFLGQRVVAHLLQRGHTPLVLARRPRPLPQGAALLLGDVAQGLPPLEGVEAVVYLVGIIRERGQTFQAAHVEGVRHTLRAMATSGIRRLVHVSALGARPGTGSRYFETKAQGEALVRESGLEWTILRPSLIFGPGDEFFGQILKGLVQSPLPFVPMIGDGSFPFRPVYVGDVAQVVGEALERGFQGSLDLVGPKEYTFRELLLLTMEALGKKKPLLPLPLPLMDLLVPLLNPLPFAPITLDQYRMLKLGNTAPLPEALRSLLPHPTPLEAILPTYLRP